MWSSVMYLFVCTCEYTYLNYYCLLHKSVICDCLKTIEVDLILFPISLTCFHLWLRHTLGQDMSLPPKFLAIRMFLAEMQESIAPDNWLLYIFQFLVEKQLRKGQVAKHISPYPLLFSPHMDFLKAKRKTSQCFESRFGKLWQSGFVPGAIVCQPWFSKYMNVMVQTKKNKIKSKDTIFYGI